MVKGGVPWTHPRWLKVTSDDIFLHTMPSTSKKVGLGTRLTITYFSKVKGQRLHCVSEFHSKLKLKLS